MPPPHGSRSRYVTGCRCGQCRQANAAYTQRWRTGREPLPMGDQRHGTINGYVNYGCRCIPCTEANRVKQIDYRAGVR